MEQDVQEGRTMKTTAIKIGPTDHGRRMSLAEFEHAEVQEGHLYELGRGVIVVSDIPNRVHFAQYNTVRRQLNGYDVTHPGRIHSMGGGGECKLLITSHDSERHPDYAIYKTAPPSGEEELWSMWIPEIVFEIVSPGSEHRDYVEKREEYLAFGVVEYWIIDASKQEMLVLRRAGGRWREKIVRAPDTYTTRLLPGLKFDCGQIFDAVSQAEN
jgi:Uma2 family endonuclease